MIAFGEVSKLVFAQSDKLDSVLEALVHLLVVHLSSATVSADLRCLSPERLLGAVLEKAFLRLNHVE